MFLYPWKNSGKCADTRDPREGFFSPRGKIPYFKIPMHLHPRIRECDIIFRGNASPVNARANSSRQRGDRAWKLSGGSKSIDENSRTMLQLGRKSR